MWPLKTYQESEDKEFTKHFEPQKIRNFKLNVSTLSFFLSPAFSIVNFVNFIPLPTPSLRKVLTFGAYYKLFVWSVPRLA